MRLSEDKVTKVREQFTALANKQADVFCNAFETFANQLPDFVTQDQCEALFSEMLATVNVQYGEVIDGLKAGINEKLEDKDYMNKIVEEVKRGRN